MSQSPLARSTRRTLPAFSRTPSKLAHSTSRHDLPSALSDSPESVNGSEYDQSTPSKVSEQPAASSSRYRSSGTSTPPHTPKIHYSPYATSTPPSALSKSTSIPFDMAANVQAGKRAQEESRRKSLAPEQPAVKKRFVRKKSLWKRMSSLPADIYENWDLHYDPTSWDLAGLPVHLANPTALVLHVIHWLLLAPLLSPSKQPDSILRAAAPVSGPGGRWDRWEDEGKVRGRGWGGGWMTLLFTLVLLALASANSIYVFTKFRTYDMQLRTATDPIPSPHASPVSAPRRRSVDSNQDEDVFAEKKPKIDAEKWEKGLRLGGRVIAIVSKWLFYTTLSIFGHRSSRGHFGGNDEKIQSLRVWEPSDFSLAFFCAFPPSAPLLSYLLTPLHPFITPILHATTSFLLSHLSNTYAQLVKDRMLLSAEVMREYDRRFVYKKVFGAKVDRSVQTEQAESLW